MTRAHKLAGTVAALLLMFSISTAPAKAQFAGGGDDMMTQFAPMLNMMKAKMGKKRFGSLMQTMGPMMSKMMDGGGFGGGFGGLGGGFGGFSGGNVSSFVGGGTTYGTTAGGETYGNVAQGGSFPTSFSGGGFDSFGGGDIMSMVTPLMGLATSLGGMGSHHRRHGHPKG